MKYKSVVHFEDEVFRLDVTSSETLTRNPYLQPAGEIRVVKFSDEEVFLGKTSEIVHIDSITLQMYAKIGCKFSNPISQGAYFNIGYKKLDSKENFSCLAIGEQIKLSGALSFECIVKDSIAADFQNNAIVILSSVSIRTGSELLKFTKYGKNWELEKKERVSYIGGENNKFILKRGRIE